MPGRGGIRHQAGARITRDQRRIAIEVRADCRRCMSIRAAGPGLGQSAGQRAEIHARNGRVRFARRPQADGSLHLLVEDTGIGMAPETIAQALEPFRQLDGSLSRRFEGTGWAFPLPRRWRNCMAAP
jgi:signal transduction histidine kinase